MLTDKYPKVIIEQEEGKILIKNLWEDESFLLQFNTLEDAEYLEKLEFPPELIGFYSIEKEFIEIFVAPLPNEIPFIKREFAFNYKGRTYNCSFGSPSEEFRQTALAFQEFREETHTAYRNLRQFRDYYRKEELPNFISVFFEGRKPVNFFIKGDIAPIKGDLVSFCKTLNFYMKYFDRQTPSIMIFPKPFEKESFQLPCITLLESFPDIINVGELDDILLDIISVANNTDDIRLKFIFYYQIIEYSAYYYLKADLKRKIVSILKSPDISYNSEIYSRSIIENFKDSFKANDDKVKIKALVKECISLESLKIELENNTEYFTRKVEFEGGFSIEPILKGELIDFSQTPKNFIESIIQNIIAIRNCIVHLRESRENKVILPSGQNDNLLLPYLYLLRRIAEKVLIHNN